MYFLSQLVGLLMTFLHIMSSFLLSLYRRLSQFEKSQGFGCILAHSMGLGKTLQMISFVDCFLRHTKAERVLIIVPVNTLQNWAHEFDQWVPSKG